MRRVASLLCPPAILGIACLMVQWAITPAARIATPWKGIEGGKGTVDAIDRWFEKEWAGAGLEPVGTADELQLLRRLSLVLHGTIPALEEVREFQADRGPQRIERWTERMLADRRFGDYFAARLSRSLLGTEGGQLVVFRRDRFEEWLSGEIRKGTPYDELARRMIAGRGLWTGEPETNFVTAAIADGNLDVNELTGRTVRGFLGQRIDCAQCHDHPFDHWKQKDFEGLAAYFGQVKQTVAGIEDKPRLEYRVEDRRTLQERVVAPLVPLHPEWVGMSGTRRERLAAWVTHRENRAFERAIVNRVWGLMFGRPWIGPVDALPDPPSKPDLLDLLGKDFRDHRCDLKRLVRVIASSRAFRLDSRTKSAEDPRGESLTAQWGMFPMTRLRPEQVIGSMLQGASIRTIDQNSQLLARVIRFFREQDFIRDYGSIEGDELEERSGTIPQVLLRMNGKLTRELTEVNPLTATGRVVLLAPTDEGAVEALFLACLTRPPTEEERVHFTGQLHGTVKKERDRIVEDCFWSLINSPEFSWNH